MTQKNRVLQMLRRGETTTAEFLAAYIPRFSARCEELRRDGYTIERTRVSATSFAYRLVAEPEAPSSHALLDSLGSLLPVVAEGDAGRAATLFDIAPPVLGAYGDLAA